MKKLLPLVAALVALSACTGDPAAAPVPRPGGPDPSDVAGSSRVAVSGLLARPVTTTRVPPGQCPVSPIMRRSPVAQPADADGLGDAPIYPIAFYAGQGLRLPAQTSPPDGLYEVKVVWAASDDYQGQVVVRVVRLDGEGRGHVVLLYQPDATVGDAVVIDVGGQPQDWPSLTYLSGPGCYAYQVDGVNFSKLIIFRATW